MLAVRAYPGIHPLSRYADPVRDGVRRAFLVAGEEVCGQAQGGEPLELGAQHHRLERVEAEVAADLGADHRRRHDLALALLEQQDGHALADALARDVAEDARAGGIQRQLVDVLVPARVGHVQPALVRREAQPVGAEHAFGDVKPAAPSSFTASARRLTT